MNAIQIPKEAMTSDKIDIQRLQETDLNEALTLFRNTVSHINKEDYAQHELDFWLSRVDEEKWKARVTNDFFIKAVNGKGIVGFASLKNGQYVDLLYVHKDYQGKGIATLLLHTLIKKGVSEGIKSFDTHASKTAQPFFTKRGFQTIKANTVGDGGMTITNYLMTLSIR